MYSNMINDKRLIISCTYLAKLILKEEIKASTPSSILKPPKGEKSLFRFLFHHIMTSSVTDMTILRHITAESIKTMQQQVGDDKNGIITDPTAGFPELKNKNEIAAYLYNQRIVNKRCKALATVIERILQVIERCVGIIKTQDNKEKQIPV